MGGGYLIDAGKFVIWLHEQKPVEQDGSKSLTDYRFYCFNGEPKMVYVYENEKTKGSEKPEIENCWILDMNWQLMPFHQKSLPSTELPPKPSNWDSMRVLARKLSKDVPFLRTDFYEIQGQIYAGELTLYPGGGLSAFYPSDWDKQLGEFIKLPNRQLRTGGISNI